MKKPKQEREQERLLYFTLDIIGDILSRLDVQTLFRLKCVCREWRDLIADPLFVNMHRQQSMNHIKYLYCSSDASPFDELTYHSVLSFYSINGQSHRRSKLSSFAFTYDELLCPITCDLVCFIRDCDIYLGNPSTHEVCVLPKPSTSLFDTKLGVGYSDQVREYKVVRLFTDSLEPHERFKMKCEIFTLSDHIKVGSSSWKPLTCPRSVYRRTISANGRIYWLIDHEASLHTLITEELILSFDIATDTFSTLPRPSSWPLRTYRNSLVFMVMEGMLCITDKRSMQKSAVLDIWMLKENCLWTKVYSINLLEYSYQGKTLLPRAIHKLHPQCMIGGEIVFEKITRIGRLRKGRFSCNIDSKTLREFTIPHSALGIFWESLFRLK